MKMSMITFQIKQLAKKQRDRVAAQPFLCFCLYLCRGFFDFSGPFVSFSFYINSSFCLSFCEWDAKLAQASAEVYFKPPIWLGSHKGAASYSQK